ncbi:hypothetical protein CIP107580_01189 [Corynebacterium diphtheriae]|nr:hypothetical protein CDB402_1175 [Corynebacterium diphtheriae INCA 402]CAB0552135.1 hypothetical protein CIP107514_01179 [Corynebacterium diphtheriae]CAB0552815.1 hypothetical protein CIP107524_01212 [Corynebacterium diphtheriae]CAB0562805.1 hypothetical protein CIP107533_01214 [Corynebacterium diphtheriae]CAB0564870.1 hypothetical protein CIP107532_01287 [Corynebacterium diphtheriae]
MTAIDPNDLAIALKVMRIASNLPEDDEQSLQLQRSMSAMYKKLKTNRRKAAKARRKAHDHAILSATATANEQRIDDETAGLLIMPRGQQPRALKAGSVATPHGFAGRLHKSHNCYICKRPYTLVDSFHHQLCPTCAADNRKRREASVDLQGRRALLTGGRAKIGMYNALKLLRDVADLTITTRFPRDAVRRFNAVSDPAGWIHRLHVIGIDLRNPQRVEE